MSTSKPANDDAEAKPHSWQKAARNVDFSSLDEKLIEWLKQSDIPGIDHCDAKGRWKPDAVMLLKYFCGQRDV